MKELDILKQNWKKSETEYKQLLYKMIHKNSNSVVKILIVFIILLFNLRKTINTSDNVNQLMYEILNVRKTVKRYIKYTINITIFVSLFYITNEIYSDFVVGKYSEKSTDFKIIYGIFISFSLGIILMIFILLLKIYL
ncbi:MAG: hypothetical protein KBA33_05735 [Cloacibacterium sp.]|nr:hypothetical protein [Cloacibacterium sp.]